MEFTYKSQRRTIEPALALVRSGRYYLIGRDVAKGQGGWRTFSMDLIEAPIRRVGTFKRTSPPAKYVADDAIGFFKGDGPPQRVEITFSKDLAMAAASRKWQRSQKVRENRDGTVTIGLTVDDPTEAIRFGLSFGDEAWVSGPVEMVARTKEILSKMRRRYE